MMNLVDMLDWQELAGKESCQNTGTEHTDRFEDNSLVHKLLVKELVEAVQFGQRRNFVIALYQAVEWL